MRELLWEHTPELVSAAESFAEEVIYIPVSATGCGPEVDAASGAFGFRPRNIKPIWAEVPSLYVMAKWLQGIVPVSMEHNEAPSTIAFRSPILPAQSIHTPLKPSEHSEGDGDVPNRKAVGSNVKRLP